MSPLEQLVVRIETHLGAIYGAGDHGVLVERLLDAMKLRERFFEPVPFANHWSEKDVALITYGDTIKPESGGSAEGVGEFCEDEIGRCDFDRACLALLSVDLG